ncbi:MAG: sugar ABC transporter ATP-binding protein [Blastocatellia bacterium]|nr:sugar ABC transporter ATP-binding protein [Blastocatellia bacterium]
MTNAAQSLTDDQRLAEKKAAVSCPGNTGEQRSPLLEMRFISKGFPGVIALQDVNLQLNQGEVLAVIGENGAGKSTLMKILGGVLSPDSGEIFIDGQPLRIESTASAAALGISFVHQELNLADNLDVASNIFLGREPRLLRWSGLRDERRLYAESKKILAQIGMEQHAHTLVRNLSPGQQQLVEIAKALSIDARILIMDEPTSSLSQHETEHLYRIIRQLRAQQVSVVYISHRLPEVMELADRVVALRDGRNSGELSRQDISRAQMVNLMVGRDINQFYHHRRHAVSQPALEVCDLVRQRRGIHPISFTLRAGEIVGIAGLVGSGRTSLAHALFGIEPPVSGQIKVAGNSIHIRKPSDSVRAGMALVPEERKEQGLILEMTVRDNVTLAGLDRHCSGKLLDKKKMSAVAADAVKQLDIRTPGIHQTAEFLSGGNQQKVVLGKWLSLSPKILILDEPTRGVDIVAKEEIYRLIEQLASEGMAILMISSDLQEVLGISDRVLVMHEHRITGEVEGDQMNEETIMHYATGGQS